MATAQSSGAHVLSWAWLVLCAVVALVQWGRVLTARRRRADREPQSGPWSDPGSGISRIGSATQMTKVRGGAWIEGHRTTWPFATLYFNEQEALLTCSLLRPITILRGEVTRVRKVRGPLGSPGLRFETVSGRLDRVTFWLYSYGSTSTAMREQGWPI